MNKNCKDIRECEDCTDSVACVRSKRLIRCSGCEDCEDCYKCNDLKGKRFVVHHDFQLTESEYREFMVELQKTQRDYDSLPCDPPETTATELAKGEIPDLPPGWTWKNENKQWIAVSDMGTTFSVDGGKLKVDYGEEATVSWVVLNISAIVAVLKANKVEL